MAEHQEPLNSRGNRLTCARRSNPNDELDPLVDFLVTAGAREVGHSSVTLLDHLVGVYVILSRWGYEADVRKAGLFHSVYGTRRFVEVLLDHSHRDAVRGIIGERAERLAFTFCEIEPAQLFQGDLRESVALSTTAGACLITDPSDREALIAVFWANALEQLPRDECKNDKAQMLRPMLQPSLATLAGIAQSELIQTLAAYDESSTNTSLRIS